ncbi:hypothetical protein K466DRAFT_596980 [Polyporus arcularius HHB13444]|uniref:BTB domain-containing protein n=1 Tax=Polyporus arcularius HHB13444 TaxID=1314778 RepID=A0A5C3PN56_9APHY|nr:hypothetical protein K466DRAFT_596980 [Polyporus arcularius HHB13444]
MDSGRPLVELVEQAARDAEFWFDDGNLVLITTPPTVAFRVYRGLLAAQSEVFAGMFAGSSSHDAESYHGCPIVQLSDSPQDLRHLLRVLLPTTKPLYCAVLHEHYHKSSSRREEDEESTDRERSLWAMSAVIRLSHKYQIQALQTQSIECLQAAYVCGLRFGRPCFDFTIPTINPGEDARAGAWMVEVIELARLTDTLSLLPALYDCVVGISPLELAKGWVREDGAVVRLSLEDMARCLEGQGKLCQEITDRTSDMVCLAKSFNCPTAARCKEAVINFCSLHFTPQSNLVSAAMYETWSDILTVSRDLKPCGVCFIQIREKEEEHRRDIWKHLAGIFELEVPGWEKLADKASI